VIPPLRLGTVNVDLAFIVLLVIVFLLMYIVLPSLINLTA
jgi:YggT family protein